MQWQHRKTNIDWENNSDKIARPPKNLSMFFSSLLNPPKDAIKQIEKIMYHLFGTQNLIRLDETFLIQEYEKGGLKNDTTRNIYKNHLKLAG